MDSDDDTHHFITSTSISHTLFLQGHTSLQTLATNGTGTEEEHTYIRTGLISRQLSDILILLLYHTAIPIIQVFGITTNSINLRLFWSMGLKDVVSACLFALSLSDLCYLSTAVLMNLLYTLHQLHVASWVRLDELSYYISVYIRWLMAISTLITLYIAVQRCCCVALPLKVKYFFTPTRNVVIIAFIYLLPTAFYLPWQLSRGMRVQVNPKTNATWVGLYRDDNYEAVLAVTDFFVYLLFPITTQTMTVICTAILIANLRKSTKFRQSTTASGVKESDSEVKDKVKGKEIQVIKAVTCVTLMFIVSNAPSICIGLARRFVPTFRAYLAYRNIFIVVDVIRDVIQQLNASLNIVVYYHFNTNYRNTFKATICCLPAKSQQSKK